MNTRVGQPETAGIDLRAKIVHGSIYGALKAMNSLLVKKRAPLPEAVIDGFKQHLVGAAKEAVKEVDTQVYLNQFWRDILDANEARAFGVTWPERAALFSISETSDPQWMAKLSEKQLKDGIEDSYKKWKSLLLYFKPTPVIAMLRQFKRSQARDLPLDRSDIYAQMKTRPYFVPATSGATSGTRSHVKRFKGDQSVSSCWCIAVDLHELGYREVSDEEFDESCIVNPGEEQRKFIPSTDWVDPRKGDLFQLIDSLQKRKSDSEDS